MLSVKEMAKRLRRSEQAITRAARENRFGTAASRDSRGRWVFRWPDARSELLKHSDYTRAAPPPAIEPPRAVYEGPGGRLEVSLTDYKVLLASCDQPDEPMLTARLVKLLDRIMDVVEGEKRDE